MEQLFFYKNLCFIQYLTILQTENWERALQQLKHQPSNQEAHQKQMLMQSAFYNLLDAVPVNMCKWAFNFGWPFYYFHFEDLPCWDTKNYSPATIDVAVTISK